MKARLTLALTVLLASIPALAQMSPMAAGHLVVVDVREIYVPQGFDDNDEVIAVLDGYLPDTCFKLAHSQVDMDRATGKIQITQYARQYDALCLPLVVPFSVEVPLGILPMGEYQVGTVGAPNERLSVAESSNAGPDDHLYAPVESARVEYDETTRKAFAIIQGRFTNTCMKWQEVQLIDSGKTKEVLPIVELEDRDDCREAEIPFSWLIDLPTGAEAGRYLLHVRSLNGKSVNTMYSIY